MEQADFGDMFIKTPKGVCTSTTVASCDALFPTLSHSSAVKTPETTEEDPDDAEAADEVEYSCD